MLKEFDGQKFEELSQEEMDFVTGARGTLQPNATPTTTSSPVCVKVSAAVSGAISSFVISFTASAFTRCRD